MSVVDEDNQLDVDDPDLVAPPVVAVVVTHDPGHWFDAVLEGLAAQDYPALSVLVVDAGSEVDPTDRVAAVLPEAYIRRLGANPGFGAAANEVLAIVEGAAFYLLCHDDVALEPGAVRALVQEAYRSNAGIAGPKLVQWNDTTRLLQVGVSVDRFGHEVPSVEPGELDQEQHDAVRDVFCVPGGATLVRADLFATLGGFDAELTFIGEDIDLCWRAQVAGARVLVVPAAVGRHRESLDERLTLAERRRLRQRHQLRAVLANYSGGTRFRVVPQLAVLNAAEVAYTTVAGRRRAAANIVDAWRWNRRHRAGLREARARLAAIRVVPDSEVRRLQSPGSARFSQFLRGQLSGGDDRVKQLTRSAGDLAGSLRRGPQRIAVAVWALLALVLVVGSRHHLFNTPPELVDLPQLPDRPWALLGEWLSGWRRAGLGGEGPQPTAYGLLGVAGTVLVGSTGLLRRLLVFLPLVLGPVGASRLLKPTGSRRARWVAAVTFAAIPLPYDAIAEGRWGGLVVWSATPWFIAALARSSGDDPYARPLENRAHSQVPQSRWRSVLALGVGTALVAAAVPVAVALPVGLALVLAIGGAIGGRATGAGGMLATGLGASGVAVLLHLPWTLEFLLPDAAWSAIGGVQPGTPAPDLAHLLRFETGPLGAAPIGWAFLVAAALPLIVGRSWRFGWAVRAWVLAAAGWGLAVLVGIDGVPFALGPPELLLAPAACGLALATALGMVAFEVDLPGYRFGWRQAASAVAAAAIAVGTVPVLGASLDGDWDAPRSGVGSVLGFLDTEQASDGPFRTLWVGDPSVLPMGAYELDDGVGWGLSDDGLPNVVERWTGSPDGTTGLVADAVDLAIDRQTARLGRLLGPAGVRYIVVVEADRPVVGPRTPVPPRIIGALGEQLDLAEVAVDEGLHVYRNTAWFPSRAVLTDGAAAAEAPRGALAAAGRADVDATPALGEVDGADRYQGPLDGGDVVWQSAASSSGWTLSGVGGADRTEGFGFGNLFTVRGDGGDATLHYSTPIYRLLLSGLQAAAWVLVLVALWRARRRARAGRERTS